MGLKACPGLTMAAMEKASLSYPAAAFRRHPPERRRRSGGRRLPEALGVAFGCVFLGFLAAALLWVPGFLAQEYLISNRMKFEETGMGVMAEVENQWLDQTAPPAPGPGTEDAVASYLDGHPWVAGALQLGTGRVWLRQGRTLVPAPQEHPARRWFQGALAQDQSLYHPPPALDPEAGQRPCAILINPRWALLKQWVPGSPEAAQALARIPGLAGGRRMEVRNPAHPSPQLGAGLPSPFELGSSGYLQRMVILFTTTEFMAQPTTFEMSPLPQEASRMALGRGLILWGSRLVILLLLAGAAHWFARKRRERHGLREETERLAAMAHGLRTPLAILKFRCDLIRLDQLDGPSAHEQLLRIGSEVEQIGTFLDTSLLAFRGPQALTATADLDRPWFDALAGDYQEFLQLEHRALAASLAPATARVREVPFRTCLQVLLDNALVHGRGTVQLHTELGGGGFRVTVHDEGPALAPDRLPTLGRPGGERPAPAPGPTGLGLGLQILLQQAKLEGWGLTFASQEGMGLIVQLTVPRGAA